MPALTTGIQRLERTLGSVPSGIFCSGGSSSPLYAFQVSAMSFWRVRSASVISYTGCACVFDGIIVCIISPHFSGWPATEIGSEESKNDDLLCVEDCHEKRKAMQKEYPIHSDAGGY